MPSINPQRNQVVASVKTNIIKASVATINVTGRALSNGIKGNDGAPGVGVPIGGTAGQVLAKIDATNYNTEWVNQSGGGGLVTSVNAQTGVVVLDTDDIDDTSINRYTNDSDITRLANTSGTNTGDQDLSGYATTSALTSGLAGKEPTIIAGTTAQYWRGDKSWQTLDKTAVGLSNVDNTSDATKNSASVALTNKDLTSGTNTFPTFNQNTTGSAATLTTSRTIGTLTGDVTSAGSTFNGSANNTNATTLATVNSNVGSFGSVTQVATFTVNAKGLTTAAGNTTIQIAESQVTNLVTDLAAKQGTITLTTTGTSGASTLIGNTLNIPNYAGGGGSAGITRSVVVTSGNVTAGATSLVDYVYIISGAHTVTLPTAIANTNLYTLKNRHSASVALAFTSGQTADGGGVTLSPNDSVDLISDGTNWVIT